MAEYIIGQGGILTLNAGSGYASLATVAYKIAAGDWTTAPELEAGTGQYGVTLADDLYDTPGALQVLWRATATGPYANDVLEVKAAPDNATIASTAAAVTALGAPAQAEDLATLDGKVDVISAAITPELAEVLAAVTPEIANLGTDVATLLARLTATRAANLDNITANTRITIQSPLAGDQTLELVQGDDYNLSDGRQIDWTTTNPGGLDLTSATITVGVKDAAGTAHSYTGSVVTATGASLKVRWQPTSAQTAALPVGVGSYDVQAELATSERVVTLASGDLIVSADISTP